MLHHSQEKLGDGKGQLCSTHAGLFNIKIVDSFSINQFDRQVRRALHTPVGQGIPAHQHFRPGDTKVIAPPLGRGTVHHNLKPPIAIHINGVAGNNAADIGGDAFANMGGEGTEAEIRGRLISKLSAEDIALTGINTGKAIDVIRVVLADAAARHIDPQPLVGHGNGPHKAGAEGSFSGSDHRGVLAVFSGALGNQAILVAEPGVAVGLEQGSDAIFCSRHLQPASDGKGALLHQPLLRRGEH